VLFSPFVYTSTWREWHTFNGTLATLTQLREVIKSLETHNVTALNFVLLLLQDNKLQYLPCTQNLIDQADEILQAFYEHPKSSKSALTWANDLMKCWYAASIRELANKENGWHFGALRASAQKLQEFSWQYVSILVTTTWYFRFSISYSFRGKPWNWASPHTLLTLNVCIVVFSAVTVMPWILIFTKLLTFCLPRILRGGNNHLHAVLFEKEWHPECKCLPWSCCRNGNYILVMF